MNLFDEKVNLPKDYDVIWMSQFLDCFKEDDIVAILKKVKEKAGLKIKEQIHSVGLCQSIIVCNYCHTNK